MQAHLLEDAGIFYLKLLERINSYIKAANNPGSRLTKLQLRKVIQTKSGFRLCIAVKREAGVIYIYVLSDLEELNAEKASCFLSIAL